MDQDHGIDQVQVNGTGCRLWGRKEAVDGKENPGFGAQFGLCGQLILQRRPSGSSTREKLMDATEKNTLMDEKDG